MHPEPRLTKVEEWNESTGAWALVEPGINLLDPRRYIERVSARGKIARAMILGPELDSVAVIELGQTSPGSPDDEEDGYADGEREVFDDGFMPALSKLEAVNRLSAIVGGGAETLGPGSKERKSLLDKLAHALNLEVSVSTSSKTELARSLAAHLGQSFSERCYSSGETITLVGLNVLLQGAERKFDKDLPVSGPLGEARRIGSVVEDVLRTHPRFEVSSAVTQMRLEESTQWRQTEWPGWYFEHIALSACFGALGGGPCKSPTTTFDFSATHIWDFKVHSDHGHVAPLNDQVAIHWALVNGGLGFVILTGRSKVSEEARVWLNGQKVLYPSRRQRREVERKRPPRAVKSEFVPTCLEFFFFEDQESWDLAIAAGIILEFQKGWKQYDGKSPRNAKYSLDLRKAARSRHLILSLDLVRSRSDDSA